MQIVMPKLGLTMTEGTLTRWCKAEGEAVKQGEILFEFESEKSMMEFECPADGVLVQILVPADQTVPCGTPVATLESTKAVPETAQRAEQVAEEQGSRGAGEICNLQMPISTAYATPMAKRRARELGVDLSAVAGRGPNGRVQLVDVETATEAVEATEKLSVSATPVAKRLASELGLDLRQISGTGPGGRVGKEDVLRAVPVEPEPVPAVPPGETVPYEVQPLTGVRSIIAQRMSQSAFTAPHVTLFTEVDAGALVAARSQLNTELAGTVKISYNTLLIAVVARALREYPQLNACLVDEKIRFYQAIHIALAVDTERGLLVPVIRDADRLDLVTIQQTGEALIERALAGKSLPDDLTGGTFTLTNLGMFEVDGFTPIINQPQAAILGVGRIVRKPVVADNDSVTIGQMMTLSLSFDHRLVDGGPAARFLQRVKQLIERPFALVLPVG